MKLLFTGIAVAFATIVFSQGAYKKVYKYGNYKSDWALVKTVSNTYGFMDRDGNLVVQPVYVKIDKFEYKNGELAMVKNVSGAYGFIDQNGKEVVAAIYWTKNEAIEQLKKM